jgi:LmbE family N-acetylglucosaminyl deacetylase
VRLLAAANDNLQLALLKELRRALACVSVCLLGAASLFSIPVSGDQMTGESPQAILHELEQFRQMGSVLYIAAHPDDENTELLAYLSRGRNFRTAYLSLTRGDGGQNVLSPDIREKLGVARTQELIAARHIDGAQQFFSRAVDFGFSKSYEETFKVWGKQEILSDMVRVIRKFHPDVLITRFSPSPGGTHGHHTASAVLAEAAFKLAGDPKAFPELGLAPWQPKRIFWNMSPFQRDKAAAIKNPLKINISGTDLVSGESFFDLAGKSRAMHKTQGFDSFRLPGSNSPERMESFALLDGAPAATDILDGVETTWNRLPDGAPIKALIDDTIAHFDDKNVSASVPALLKLRTALSALPKSEQDDPLVHDKRVLLDNILQSCLGLHVETTIPQAEVVPGEGLKLHHVALLDSSVPVKWIGVKYPLLKKEMDKKLGLHAHEKATFDASETLPKDTALTQPWWLRSEGTAGLFKAENPELIGTAENDPDFPVVNIFEVAGQILQVADQPVAITKNTAGVEIRRKLDVIPPVSLRIIPEVTVMTPGASRTVEVEITAARADSSGTVRLEGPGAWKIEPSQASFHLSKVADIGKFKFTVKAPGKPDVARLLACAEINGERYCNQREEISYPHLPPQLLQSPAVLKVLSIDFVKKGTKVGYLPGAGDTLVENMQQLGYDVKVLDDEHLTGDDLSGLDAVVVGVRAFNVRKNIANVVPLLFDYVKNGGTIIAQYNRPDNLKGDKVAPYDLHISTDRVTDETSAVTFLAPEHPVLNTPNKITSADFADWVQERGLYFPNHWDEHFVPILSISDPGEQPTQGSLLVAPYGKGYYIYTGLSFFRELPAGVPGAYRLLANLLSIGK